MNKLSPFLYKSLTILLFSFCILMGFNSFDNIENIRQNLFVIKMIHTLSLFIFIMIISYVIIHQKLSTKVFLTGLLSLSFILRLIFILQNNPEQVSDFLFMYQSANELAKGNADALKTDYFNFAVFNAPFTIYESYILKWFHSITLLKILSVVYSTLIVWLIYKIGKSLYGEKAARIAGFIACIFPPFIIYNTILTNQTLSILFILAGVYFFVNKKNIKGGLLLALGQIFRPIGIMFLLGAVFIIILEWLQVKDHFSKKRMKDLFLSILKLIIPYYIFLFSISGLLTGLNFTQHGLFHNPAPSYKFLVGLNSDTNGGYSEEDNLLMNSNINGFEQTAKELINIRTIDLMDVSKLFENKFKTMWGSEDASFYWAGMSGKSFVYQNQLLWVVILFAIGSLIFIKYKNKSYNYRQLYIPILLLGFIGIYFLIEIQTRYRYEIYPLFLLVGSTGILSLLEKLNESFVSDKKRVIIVTSIIMLLFVISLLPKSSFQRVINKEIPIATNFQTISVNEDLTEKLHVKQLIVTKVNDSLTVLRFELNDNVRTSDLYKYAITLRSGIKDDPSTEKLWDFKPILYQSKEVNYLETTILNIPESVNYFSFALYDKNGFTEFKSPFIQVEL